MPNPIKGELAFEVEGESYLLVLDVDALCAAESLLRPRVAGDIVRGATSGEMTATRALLWAALQAKQPELVLADASALMGRLGLQRATELVIEAASLAFPAPEGRKGQDPQATPGPGTSRRSTSAG